MLDNILSRPGYEVKIPMLIFTILVASTIAGQNFISILGYKITSGTLIYPFTFPLVASLTELYGFRYARSVIWTGAFCNLLMAIIIFIISMTPSSQAYVGDVDIYHRFCERMTKLITFSTLAFIVSEYANAWILSRLGVLIQGKFLLIRALLSVSSAVAIDTWIIFPLFLTRQKNISIALKETFAYMMIKIIMEICLLPVFWAIVEYVRRREGGYHFSEIPECGLPFTSVQYIKTDPTLTGIHS